MAILWTTLPICHCLDWTLLLTVGSDQFCEARRSSNSRSAVSRSSGKSRTSTGRRSTSRRRDHLSPSSSSRHSSSRHGRVPIKEAAVEEVCSNKKKDYVMSSLVLLSYIITRINELHKIKLHILLLLLLLYTWSHHCSCCQFNIYFRYRTYILEKQS